MKLRSAGREARLEAAPFAFAILLANGFLAVVSRDGGLGALRPERLVDMAGRRLPGGRSSSRCSAIGPQRLGLDHLRRELATVLLGFLWAGTTLGITCVIVSLMHWRPSGTQLLASAAVVLVTNVLTFSLVFWELDSGGPVKRALAESRKEPDFQFPQDENPQLANPGWRPALFDFLYLSLTNSIAFSPTDAMPLTHRAKLFMGLEAGVSGVTVLVVAARAINILGS